jgi:hypothetical protein
LLFFAYPDNCHPEKAWEILSASTVVIRPTRREICIFNNGTRIGNIKKHGILFPVQGATIPETGAPHAACRVTDKAARLVAITRDYSAIDT